VVSIDLEVNSMAAEVDLMVVEVTIAGQDLKANKLLMV
jgi:hypothetical protein